MRMVWFIQLSKKFACLDFVFRDNSEISLEWRYILYLRLFVYVIYIFYDIKLTSVIFIELIILRADLTRLYMLETTRYLCRKVELCRLLRQWKLHIVCFWSWVFWGNFVAALHKSLFFDNWLHSFIVENSNPWITCYQ